MGIFLQPFAWLLLFFYNLFNSYGLALILFGVVIKLVLFPVTLKSKKSMIQTTMLSSKSSTARTRSAITWRSRSSISGRRSTPWGAASGP